MIVNGMSLYEAAPIKDMFYTKHRSHGVSFGLAEAGYDIRLKQDITFSGLHPTRLPFVIIDGVQHYGTFIIASAIEEFQMPDDLVGVVHDKSTWARKGLSVFNTVIEPGWSGFLTMELVYHNSDELHIPAGSGIAQVLFSRLETEGAYNGKYQNQADRPVDAVFE